MNSIELLPVQEEEFVDGGDGAGGLPAGHAGSPHKGIFVYCAFLNQADNFGFVKRAGLVIIDGGIPWHGDVRGCRTIGLAGRAGVDSGDMHIAHGGVHGVDHLLGQAETHTEFYQSIYQAKICTHLCFF